MLCYNNIASYICVSNIGVHYNKSLEETWGTVFPPQTENRWQTLPKPTLVNSNLYRGYWLEYRWEVTYWNKTSSECTTKAHQSNSQNLESWAHCAADGLWRGLCWQLSSSESLQGSSASLRVPPQSFLCIYAWEGQAWWIWSVSGALWTSELSTSGLSFLERWNVCQLPQCPESILCLTELLPSWTSLWFYLLLDILS